MNENTTPHAPEYSKDASVYVALDYKQKRLIQDACRIKGVAAGAKGRELLLDWAKRVMVEEGV